MKNQNDQLLKLWFLQATEALCHLSVTDIKKPFCNVWFFCKNEACVNCGTLNATTLIWLVRRWDSVIFLHAVVNRNEASFYTAIKHIPYFEDHILRFFAPQGFRDDWRNPQNHIFSHVISFCNQIRIVLQIIVISFLFSHFSTVTYVSSYRRNIFKTTVC